MIFLIKSGQYSDTVIHGYFTNAEDAYTYCALKNKGILKKEDDDWWYGGVRVEPIEEIKVEFPQQRPRMVYEYTGRFSKSLNDDLNGVRWVMEYFDDEPKAYPWEDQKSNPVVCKWRKQTNYLGTTSFFVSVNIDKPDSERAKKHMQDCFYQIIAKKEGISV